MTQTPAPTTEATISESESESERMAGLVKPLVWTDPAPPNDIDCRYDHVRADTPFGQISIEWKSWKEYDPYDVFFQDGYIESQDSLDAAKAAAQSEYVKRILSALDLSLITQQAAENAGLRALLPTAEHIRAAAERERDAARAYATEMMDESAAFHAKLAASESREAALLEKVRVMGEALGAIVTWADQRCPCHNELPNPCPLCGASVENLEACKSAENTLPRTLLATIRAARAHNPSQGEE